MILVIENKNLFSEKFLSLIKSFVERYVKKINIYFCIDFLVIVVVIEGLVKYKDELGVFLCLCCYYEDK